MYSYNSSLLVYEGQSGKMGDNRYNNLMHIIEN